MGLSAMTRNLSLAVVFGLFLAVADSPAATISTGNNPQPNEDNILLNNGTTGPTVFGTTSQGGLNVMFFSPTDVLSEPSAGQARIESLDGLLNTITVSVPGGSFGDLIFNQFNGSGTSLLTIGTLSGSGASSFSASFALGVGQNFFTVLAGAGETLTSVTISSPGGIADLRQVRISDARLTSVPDAGSTLGLLTAGMLVLACARRRL